MKKLLTLIAILGLASLAAAEMSAMGGTPGVTTVDHNRDMFWCQMPTAMAANGSSAFDAEEADDIPDDFVGMSFNTVGGWILQWGSTWMDPTGVYINIYNGECPPDMSPAQSYYFAWGDLYTEYQPMGGYDVYYFEALLPDTWTVDDAMSIGFVADIAWGQNAPYVGFALTDYEVFGCGEMHWAGDYWGYPRWTPFGQYGYLMDLAYCLGGGTTAAGEGTWSSVKSLY